MAGGSDSPTIPRIIHQIWLGPRVPDQVEGWLETWRRLHPTWEHRLWRDDDLDWLRLRGHFDAADQPAIKADIARLEIVERFGGLYVDADIEAHRAVDPLLGEHRLVLLSEGDLITNALFGAEPGHATISAALRLLKEIPHGDLNVSNWAHPVTGPMLLTRAAIETGAPFEDSVAVLASEVACLPRARHPEIVAMARERRWMTHHATASWRDERSLAMLLRRTKLRTRLRRFVDLSAT
jgi:hypothetical protein